MYEFICVISAIIEHNGLVVKIDLDGRKHSIAGLNVRECEASAFPGYLEPDLLVALFISQ